ncbi:MAG TPA: CHASE3 domain-containing protein [Myxococcales bacterium]|nr:CHASE3 domain-containing protein [Myxococcales bacterium]
MPGPSRPRIRGSLVAVLGAGALFALFCANLITLFEVTRAREAVSHHQQLQDALARLRHQLADAETGQEGFLLTGDAGYLHPFEAAKHDMPLTIAELRRLEAFDADQARRLETLERLASHKLAELDGALDLRRSGNVDAALAAARSSSGAPPMEEARGALEEVRAAEERRVGLLSARVTRDLTIAIGIDVTAGLGLLLLGILLFLVDRDVARREELERALREAAVFQQGLLGIVGHDLRNPLGSILVAAGMLEKRGLAEDQAKTVHLMRVSAQRMNRMVEQLLDLTRAQLGGGIPVSRATGTDLASIVAQAAAELRLGHPGCEIRETRDGDTGGLWDPDRLAQVASNLLGNAVKHGGSPVDVSVRGAGEAVALEVHNGGPPIPAELLPMLFDPFRRGREARTGVAQADGLGLGLAICRAVVEAHGGKLEATSSAAEGTTFRAVLPRQPAK